MNKSKSKSKFKFESKSKSWRSSERARRLLAGPFCLFDLDLDFGLPWPTSRS